MDKERYPNTLLDTYRGNGNRGNAFTGNTNFSDLGCGVNKTITQARKKVSEYLAMCGAGQTEFTDALNTLYATTIQQEETIKRLSEALGMAKENCRQCREDEGI